MKFAARNEAGVMEKKLRREMAEYTNPKFVLYYESGNRDCSTAANIIARSVGGFSEATLLFQWCLIGDGGHERVPNDERWRPYRR